MQEATITRALVELRARIIRERLDGLAHVEALLRLRRQRLAPVPRKVPRVFKRTPVRHAVLRLLRGGPMTLRDMAERLHAEHPEGPLWRVYSSVSGCLTRLHRAGIVRHEGRLWGRK